MLLGSWHGVKMEEPGMDSFFINSQHYIDTFGKNGSPESNMELYGVANMDSLRNILQLQLDSTKAVEQNAVTNTIFTFRQNGTIITSFSGNLDTGGWSLKDDKSLILQQLTGKDSGMTQNAEIISIDKDELKLRFEQDHSFVNVTFHHEAK